MSDDRELDSSVTMALAERLGRRPFLRKVALAATSLATALVGVSVTAQPALAFACCSLCHASTVCSGACCWSWSCCGAGHLVICKECYSSTQGCSGGCPSKCSQGTVTHLGC